MRIISQDGRLDIPYEKFCIASLANGGITATERLTVDSDGHINSIKFAEYQNEEKAIKALEMLREKYSILKTIEMFSLETIKEVFNSEEASELDKPYFQFPKDDEIELDEENQ